MIMKAFITLDYELFMGKKSGTPEKCLIEPMDNLTTMLDKYGVKLNVFVDAAYLLRVQELKDSFPALQRDFELVTEHIKKLDREGHAIQLHLHPQWSNAIFDGKVWVTNTMYYKLSDLPLAEQLQMIRDGSDLLNSLIKHNVSAYRGGGYCVDNFSELYDTFLSNGVIYDTSVLRGEKSRVHYKKFDYSRVPKLTSYRIKGDVTKPNHEGLITEYPISTIVVPAWKYLVNKKKAYTIQSDSSNVKWGDGMGAGYQGSKLSIFKKRFEMFFGNKCIRASVDGGAMDLEKVYDYSKKHYKGDDFIVIGHPKLITPLSIHNLEVFIANHPEIEFTVFS